MAIFPFFCVVEGGEASLVPLLLMTYIFYLLAIWTLVRAGF